MELERHDAARHDGRRGSVQSVPNGDVRVCAGGRLVAMALAGVPGTRYMLPVASRLLQAASASYLSQAASQKLRITVYKLKKCESQVTKYNL